MASPIMTALLLDSGNIRTPRGRLYYPHLFEKSAKRGETDPKKFAWQTTILFPKGSDLTALEAAVKETLEEKFPAKVRAVSKIKTPFIKTADQPRLADYADDYPIMLRLNAKQTRPDVVSPNGQVIYTQEQAEPDEVYSGRWARVTVRPFGYDVDGSKGVSLGLQNVQLLLGPDGEPGEALAGGRVRGTSEFEAASDDALAGMDV